MGSSRSVLRRMAVAVAAVLAVSAVAADAAAPSSSITSSATADQPATAVQGPALDMVSVAERTELSDAVRDQATNAADAVRAAAVVGRGFTIGMKRVERGTTVMQQAGPAGWQYPMGVTALPVDTIASIMGRTVAGPIGIGQLVMAQTSATMRGAQAGDTVDLVAASGAILTYTIGLVAPDASIGGAELVMSINQADQLGATVPTRVLIYGQFDRGALDAALAERGLASNSSVKIRHSWDPPDPDSTLGLMQTKSLLGEFSYVIGSAGDIAVDSTWRNDYIPQNRELYASIGIRAACNRVIKSDLQAALTDIANAGLAGGIDLANTNTYGGCYYPRFNRIGGSIGSLSRHSWGEPLDTNTLANCQGCVPKMDCRIVRIFRAHGFAWGGNFTFSDGMHFEWVGTQGLDKLQFPSKYCPNPAPSPTESVAVVPVVATGTTFFADDAWAADGPE
jgi:hypothetical protein